MDRAANQLVRVEQGRRLGLYAAVLFVVFLLGFVPMWLQARARANERDAAHQALRLSQLETTLAAAAIQARRGDYDPAREAASHLLHEPDRRTRPDAVGVHARSA